MSLRDEPRFNDEDIMILAQSVEAHDFDRIDPPAQVWNNILTELEVEVASQEATARRKQNPWFQPARLLSIAAVTLLMVGVAVAVVNRGGDSAPLEVASATMTDEGLPISTPETAGATFVCEGSDGDQQCFIELDLTALPEAGTDNLELWVINGDVTDMHSLGNVTAADGRFALPDDLTTPDSFPIVDISLEPDDGDSTHSGKSVLRGVLES